VSDCLLIYLEDDTFWWAANCIKLIYYSKTFVKIEDYHDFEDEDQSI